MLNLVPVMWLECCVPSGGQSDATETAQLVPQDAFLLHYWEERWQSLKWHKLSACIVLNQSSRRTLKRSAVRSQHGHNKHSPHTAWDSYLVRQHLLYSNLKSCLHYISATKSTLAIVLLRMFKKICNFKSFGKKCHNKLQTLCRLFLFQSWMKSHRPGFWGVNWVHGQLSEYVFKC